MTLFTNTGGRIYSIPKYRVVHASFRKRISDGKLFICERHFKTVFVSNEFSGLSLYLPLWMKTEGECFAAMEENISEPKDDGGEDSDPYTISKTSPMEQQKFNAVDMESNEQELPHVVVSSNISVPLSPTVVNTQAPSITQRNTQEINLNELFRIQRMLEQEEFEPIESLTPHSSSLSTANTFFLDSANTSTISCTTIPSQTESLQLTTNVSVDHGDQTFHIDPDTFQDLCSALQSKSISSPCVTKQALDSVCVGDGPHGDIEKNSCKLNNTKVASSSPQTLHLSTNNPSFPEAVIKMDMVNGKPFYAIHVMGQKILFSAITIPTPDGPMQLQSGPSFESSQSNNLSIPEISEANLVIATTATQSVPQYPSSITSAVVSEKPKFTCEICNKSYVKSWKYYAHLREHECVTKEFKCSFCSKSFAQVNSLKQHLLTHTGQKSYLCTICDKAFSNPSSLRVHQLSHAEDNCSFECPNCNKTFLTSTSMKIHQRVHQNEKPYVCNHDGCGKAFRTPSELARHEFRHTGAKPFKCDQCSKSFVRNDDLKRHYFIHTGHKRFKCDKCDFSCIQSFDLVKHKYIHGGEKPYKCECCNKQFTRPARLKEHQRIHTGEKPFKCDTCCRSFSQLTSLKSHQLTHKIEKPYHCEHCTKEFISSDDLLSHTNVHLGIKPFQCTLCNKMFVSEKTLKRHAIVHSGVKPFACSICKKTFARSSDLKVHMPVHDEEKPFKCTKCEKMFTRTSTLKEHLRLHTGEFPFKCETCNKIFNHRSHYNVHVRTHTGEKPFKCELCPKEFARKASLQYHMRSHNTELVTEGDLNKEAFNEDQMMLPCLQPSLKRKQTDVQADDSFLNKRQITSSSQLTNFNEGVPSSELKVGEVSVMSLGSLLNSDHLIIAHSSDVPETQLVTLDGGTVVALNLSDLQQVSALNTLEVLPGIDSQLLAQQRDQIINLTAGTIPETMNLEQIGISTSVDITSFSGETPTHEESLNMEQTLLQLNEQDHQT